MTFCKKKKGMTKLARTYISAVTNEIRNKESTKPSLPLPYDITVYFSLILSLCKPKPIFHQKPQ